MKKNKLLSILALLLMLVMVFVACDPTTDKDRYDDESAYTDLSVRSSSGKNGAVAAANAYASKAGYDILRKGGNAFDAAVAISFAIGVTEPYASGVGGGGVMTAYNAKTGEYIFYNFREFLSGTSTYQAYVDAGHSSVPKTGIYSVGVPTQVAGLVGISQDLGVLSLSESIAPAISLAENGFVIAKALADAINLETFSNANCQQALDIYSDGFSSYTIGDKLIQQDYAEVLKLIAEYGAEGFYTGTVAQAIVDASSSRNGFITMEDMTYAMNNYPKKGEPLSASFNGYDIYTANTPSSGGIILAETLNMLSHYSEKNGVSLESLGHNSAEYLHLVGTALQLSFADKRHYIADNDINPSNNLPYVDVPIAGLSSKEYAAQRFDHFYRANETVKLTSSYDWGGASGDKSPFEYQPAAPTTTYGVDTWEDDNGTTSFSVADKDGNIVSITQTLNHFWGALVMPQDCGFFLNDQLTSFSVKETASQSVHYIAPYKQPVSHIMPTIILKEGKPVATIGSPGSMRIPSAVVQVILNYIVFDMDIQEAIEAPRMHSYCVQTADTAEMKGGATYKTHKLFYLESKDTDTATMTALQNKQYYVYSYSKNDLFFGGVQAIVYNYDPSNQYVNMTGAADSRRDGKALAY